tara:strand:- start:548 stop:667 length:120 start_codon:yes stop_codon:yes gene_type:complete
MNKVESELKWLINMKVEGLITDEEYSNKRLQFLQLSFLI